jgi:hypothetical protein
MAERDPLMDSYRKMNVGLGNYTDNCTLEK